MNARRNFFKSLIGGAGAIAAASNLDAGTALVKPEVIEVPNHKSPLASDFKEDLTHAVNGQLWYIHWSGWKEEASSENIVGQWTAKTGDAGGAFLNGFHGVFATTGGMVAEYHCGYMFFTGTIGDYPLIISTSPQDIKDVARELAFTNLWHFIHNSPLADRAKCYRCGAKREDDPRYNSHNPITNAYDPFTRYPK